MGLSPFETVAYRASIGIKTMRITVNDEPRQTPDEITVAGLLGELGLAASRSPWK